MIKNEYEFTFMVGEPTIGEGIVLKLKDGSRFHDLENRRHCDLHLEFYLP